MFEMFSEAGNQRVADILKRAVELSSELNDDDAVWQYAYSRLELLGREAEFGEATDTAVRSSLWEALIDAGAIKNWHQVQYWFYVDWLDLGQPNYVDLFKKQVDALDADVNMTSAT